MRKNTQNPYKGNYLLATTDVLEACPHETFAQFYKDETGCSDKDVPDEYSDEYFNYACSCRDMECESTLEEIKGCRAYDIPCVITGSLGLWHGRREIVPVVCRSVHDAINRILRDSSYQDWTLRFIEGHIRMEAYHHDGTNIFSIEALSAKGLRSLLRAEARYDDFEPGEHDTKRLPYLYAIS